MKRPGQYKEWPVLLLIISIVNANELPEYSGPRSVAISEAEPVGAHLLNFTVTDQDDDPLTVTINYNQQFNLESLPTQGVYRILLKEKLDREALSRYTIRISISDGTFTETVEVRVRVQDVNDYTPIITNLPLIASVRENQPIGTFVLNITAQDDDMGYNAATEISLQQENSLPFFLGDFHTKQPVEHSYGQATVLLSRALDYESRELYLVRVTVTDMAGCTGSSCQEPLTTTQTLRVNVIDEQDTPPSFRRTPYVANTEENLPVGSHVFQVTAVDGDTASPRDIQYFFIDSDGNRVNQIDYFTINSVTGEITNAEVIDTDSQALQTHGSLYQLTVLAKEVVRADEEVNAVLDQSTTAVTISVLDLNDLQPTFTANQSAASVGEALPAGVPARFDQTLRVMDRDQGPNCHTVGMGEITTIVESLTCHTSIMSANNADVLSDIQLFAKGINGSFTLRALNSDGGVSEWFTVSPSRVTNEAIISLATIQEIDFETTPRIVVKIEAREQQSGLTSYTTVSISIEDSNDNRPEFSHSSYEGAVREDSRSGDFVQLTTAINVTDEDSSLYGRIYYSFTGDSQKFSIDRDSGEVTVSCDDCLDRESQPVYYLNILVTDGGGLTNTAQLVVRISDVNDKRPQFSASIYRGSLNESSTHFFSDVVVQATDEDEADSGMISYTILNYTDHFNVYSNGTVYITSALDAEAFPSILEVQVMASDGGLPALTATALLRLELKDLNDNRPRFSQSVPLLDVPENSELGTVICAVSAVDDDRSEPNNEITYSLISGDFEQFVIEPQTGRVKVSKSLDREGDRNEYSLIVSASDNGQPIQSAQQTITVKITDVNDESPEFTQDPYRFSVNEGSATGISVGSVSATDPDLTSSLSYNISQTIGYSPDGATVTLNNDVFHMGSTSGAITVSSAIDREAISRIVLTITAEDINGITQQISSGQVEITVADINDNPPVIQPVGILEVEENSEYAILAQLVVSDNDQDAQLEFSISNNPDGAFYISNQGELRLIKAVDREIVLNWLNLTVVVQDGVSNALSSSIEIAVRVRDVNDESPQFRDFQSNITVQEDVDVGYELGVVYAVDADFDEANRLVQYRIQSGGQGKVSIDRTSGVLRVVGDLDRDLHQFPDNTLSLVVEVCDSAVPQLCSNRTMNIRIVDINDNTPTFTRQTYMAWISERAQANDTVVIDQNTLIRAEDIDATPNGQNVKYSCCSPSNDTQGLFTVNLQGQIVVAPGLGLLGHSGIYRLTVKATDWGRPNRTGSAIVIVRVIDYNDHAPVLRVAKERTTTVHRPENSTRGEKVITIIASDDDVGINSLVDLFFVTDVLELDSYRYFYIERSDNGDSGSGVVNTFIIRQNITFDRESSSRQFKFGVIGKDRGRPQLSSTVMEITVNVDDVNDNKPYFPVDKQLIEVEVREEEVGVSIASVNYALDDDGRQFFCYYIIGARNSKLNVLPAHEGIIEGLFTIDSRSGEVRLAEGQKLDREAQESYVLVIKADDRDANVYSNCGKPINTPWTHQKADTDEMELSIIVQDINDNPPTFSKDQFTLAVVRDVAAPTILTKLQEFVSDPDEDQAFVFSRGRGFTYSPSTLETYIKVAEPVRVYANGEIKSEITFTERMQGNIMFGAVATDSQGHSSETLIKVLIINSDNVVVFTVSKDMVEVRKTIRQFKEIFRENANWNVSVIEVKENADNTYHTDIHLFIMPNSTDNPPPLAREVLQNLENRPSLLTALRKYGYVESKAATDSSTTDEEPTSNRVMVIAIVIGVVLVVIVVLVLVLCYVMRSRYKRKLKAAHAMAFDTHTLGFEIDQADVPQSVNNIPGSANHSTPVSPADDKLSATSLLYPRHVHEVVHEPYCLTLSANQSWNKDSPLNNFDWGNANGAFDRESHRSSHSHDDNAIDPLNGVETQSCSSGDSQDWRLDLRGNNLDCSPPPPITDEVIQSVLNEHNNQLNYDSKFADSQSDHSNSTNKEDGHFNRLIMSDSVYGKIYETRRTANGLETTEV